MIGLHLHGLVPRSVSVGLVSQRTAPQHTNDMNMKVA